MTKPPLRHRTTKSVAVRRAPGDAPPPRKGEVDGTAPARDHETVPDMPRQRRPSKADGAAAKAETTRARRDTKGDDPPSSRRDTKNIKQPTVPPRSGRDSKAPKRDSKAPKESPLPPADEALLVSVRGAAPFRVSGELLDPEGTRYSVIPAPRSSKKPRG